MDRERHVADFI